MGGEWLMVLLCGCERKTGIRGGFVSDRESVVRVKVIKSVAFESGRKSHLGTLTNKRDAK